MQKVGSNPPTRRHRKKTRNGVGDCIHLWVVRRTSRAVEYGVLKEWKTMAELEDQNQATLVL